MADEEKPKEETKAEPPPQAEAPAARPARPARAAKAEGPPAADQVANRASVGPGASGSPAAAEEQGVTRRGFLSWLTVGWLAFSAMLLGSVTGMVRFLFPNVLFEPAQTFRAGRPDEYAVGEVSTRFKDSQAVWIVRTSSQLYVLSTVCTHLGCTPNWLVADQKFKCPCHGSGFRASGINFEGPAPRPLERFRVVIDPSGQILIDKTKKYQYEKGEWSDPESFLVL